MRQNESRVEVRGALRSLDDFSRAAQAPERVLPASAATLSCAGRCGPEPSVLHVQYLSLAEHALPLSHVLGVATFGPSPRAVPEQDVPVAHVPAPLLDGTTLSEVWSSSQPVRVGQHGPLRFRATGELLLGSIAVAEQPGDGALHLATRQAYSEMLATADDAGYPYLVRIWNYLGAINTQTHGEERYRQFNSARQLAFTEAGRAVAGGVPAACALGTPAGSPLLVYFLASRRAPTFIENPRQMSAYHYPAEYGARSPVFSRAAVLQHSGRAMLFLSGTASILGHRTVHPGDVVAQTRETLTNIRSLIEEATRRAQARFMLAELALKVYVRRPADLPLIQRELRAAVGEPGRVLYLQADICRKDLLVEIEATGPATGP